MNGNGNCQIGVCKVCIMCNRWVVLGTGEWVWGSETFSMHKGM